jgi:hypothetical protein
VLLEKEEKVLTFVFSYLFVYNEIIVSLFNPLMQIIRTRAKREPGQKKGARD